MSELPEHMPPLNWLRSFEASARLGSYTAAARELNITQSAVSQQIRLLEAHLHEALFFREGRRMRLTEAGVNYTYFVNGRQCFFNGLKQIDGLPPLKDFRSEFAAHPDRVFHS